MLAWNEARLRDIAAGHEPAESFLEAWAADANEAATALVRERLVTSRSRTWPRWSGRPSRICPTIRFPTGSRSARSTTRTSGRSGRPTSRRSSDHWGYVEPSDEDYERFIGFPYHDPTLWKIAWDDEGVAGQVKSFIDTAQNEAHGRQRGWTEAISTSRRWRRRGVAKALIVESIRELAARGMTEVALGVHTENPNGAYALYQSLGYEVVRTWTTYRKLL